MYGLQPKPPIHLGTYDQDSHWVRDRSVVMPFWAPSLNGFHKHLPDGGVGDIKPVVTAYVANPWSRIETLGYTPRTSPGSSAYKLTHPALNATAFADEATIAGVMEFPAAGAATAFRGVVTPGTVTAPSVDFGPVFNFKESTDQATFGSGSLYVTAPCPQGSPFSFVGTVRLGGDINLWINGEHFAPTAADAAGFWTFTHMAVGAAPGFGVKNSQNTIPYLLVVAPREWGAGEAEKFSRDPFACVRR